LGAATPDEYGDYYAWGEMATKGSYTWDNYAYGNVSALNKYCSHGDLGIDGFRDNKTTLDAIEDVAHYHMGSSWRIPTQAEFQELLDNCTWTLTDYVGASGIVAGYKVQSKINGNAIFLPLAGHRQGDSYFNVNESARYWSNTRSNQYSYNAYLLDLRLTSKGISDFERCLGYNIRPVLADEAPENVFSIYFHPNGANIGSMEPVHVNEMEYLTIPDCAYQSSDETLAFSEWNTQPDGSGQSIRPGETFWASQSTWSVNTVLFAQWATPEVTVSVTGQYYGYDFVDLGLPSGTRWATSNLGSSAPESYGNYYMWGDTRPVDVNGGSYTAGLDNYPYYKDGRYTKYLMYQPESGGNIDKKMKLTSGDDAAHMTMRGHWRMPDLDDVEELLNNCTRQYTSINGVNGLMFIGPNGNSVFFPCTGCYIGGSNNFEGTTGDYWTSQLTQEGNEEAIYMTVRYQETGEYSILTNNRAQARPIRAVYRAEEPVQDEFTVTYFGNGGKDEYNGDLFWQDFQEGETKALASILPNEVDPLFTRDGYAFAGWNTQPDGTGTYYAGRQNVSLANNMTLYAQWISVSGVLGEHYYVDLGLPSGLKWATCNVGANSPYQYGDYFAWGETSPKSTYSWDNYKYGTSEDNLTKYNENSALGTVDNKTTLEASDDAARINWKRTWRMPTFAEQEELRQYCIWTWVTINGVNGCKVTSKMNGNSIFLPAAGSMWLNDEVIDAGDRLDYWSSSLYDYDKESNFAYQMNFYTDPYWCGTGRYHGTPIRAVSK
ncbi:MAG: InlB B-repeat-containing protein, partial [Bacteroidales bacterium]|nr:InlB B-repeat-containing protein [Bacteroidales bacterium]